MERIADSLDRITVPNLTAAALIELAKKELKLTYLDDELAYWDFFKDEHGKTYEVQVWNPGREVIPATEVRKHFKDGFVGNTPAFITWVIKHSPNGYHASIPPNDRLFVSGNHLDAPRFVCDDEDREINLYSDVRNMWGNYWFFVAFREFKNT